MSPPLDARSMGLRDSILNILTQSGMGHLGAPLSVVEILRVLYDHVLKYDPKNPRWPERDRLILSKGHACLALYVLLAEKGFFPEIELSNFCKPGAMLGGSPEHGKTPGIDASTGSLGHGLSIGIGFALSARFDRSDRRVFVIVGDGESNEGTVWEAALCAGKHRLSQLTVIVDYNKQQNSGSTYEIQDMEPFADKWKSFGFATANVDGHDVEALKSLFGRLPLDPGKPTAIICDTVKGKGGKKPLTAEEAQAFLAALAGAKR
ncbi:MAG: transketolase [Elusimicrobiota bacterium]